MTLSEILNSVLESIVLLIFNEHLYILFSESKLSYKNISEESNDFSSTPAILSFSFILKFIVLLEYNPGFDFSLLNLVFSSSTNVILSISGALLSGIIVYVFTSKPSSVGYFIVTFDTPVKLLTVNNFESEFESEAKSTFAPLSIE